MLNRQDDVLNQQLSITALENELPPIAVEPLITGDVSYFTTPIFVSSIMLFLISVLVFVLMGYLIKNNKEPNEVLKTFGIPLIIVASVFVVITGLDINKLTPVIGLLGTIAGYLLGKSEGKNGMDETSQTKIEIPKKTNE